METQYWCKFSQKFVHKSVKTYRTGSGRVVDQRDVCSCGCNTDWKDIVRETENKGGFILKHLGDK